MLTNKSSIDEHMLAARRRSSRGGNGGCFTTILLILMFILSSCLKEEQGYICSGTDCYGEFEVWVPDWQAEDYCNQLIIEDCKCKKL